MDNNWMDNFVQPDGTDNTDSSSSDWMGEFVDSTNSSPTTQPINSMPQQQGTTLDEQKPSPTPTPYITMPEKSFEDDRGIMDMAEQTKMGAEASAVVVGDALSDFYSSVNNALDVSKYNSGDLSRLKDAPDENTTTALSNMKADVMSYEDNYMKKYGERPAITGVMKYAPDIATIFLGKKLNTPTGAALTEYLLEYGRSALDGKSGTEQQLNSASSAILAGGITKLLTRNMDLLSPQDFAVIDHKISTNPEGAQNFLTTLEWINNHGDVVNPDLVRNISTHSSGNYYIDEQINKTIDRYGIGAATDYFEALKKISNTGESKLSKNALDFANDVSDAERAMHKASNEAWDAIGAALPRFNSTGEPIRYNIAGLRDDIESSISDHTIKNFTKRLFDGNDKAFEIKALDTEIKGMSATISNMREARFPKKQIKYRQKLLKDLMIQRNQILEERGKNTNLSDLEQLTTLVKKLNNKHYVSGGNVNLSDQSQMHDINVVRTKLMKFIEQADGGEEYVKKLEIARAKYRELADTFGYAGTGKNMGVEVPASEMADTLGEIPTNQYKTYKSLMKTDPYVFMEKMGTIKKHVSDDTFKAMKRNYIEDMLGYQAVWKKTGHNFSKINFDVYNNGMKKLLDNPDGKAMVKELYGQEAYNSLMSIKTISQELSDGLKYLPRDSDVSIGKLLKRWAIDGPVMTWKTLTGKSNSHYTRAMINAYRSALDPNAAKLVKANRRAMMSTNVPGLNNTMPSTVIGNTPEAVKGAAGVAGGSLAGAGLINVAAPKKKPRKMETGVKKEELQDGNLGGFSYNLYK